MLGGDDGRTLYIVADNYSRGGASDGIVLGDASRCRTPDDPEAGSLVSSVFAFANLPQRRLEGSA
jgi:hypothetical protein